jgi:phosphoglycerol transferase MdoB-like AlkP superfamily enzyme
MQSIFDLEFIRQFNNLLILALGALAIIFILRGVFKVAWKVIKIIFVLLGLLLLFGWLFGYIHISLA